MILVDTSVWIDHLRSGDPRLADALEQGLVLTHPFIVGELACGNLRSRDTLLPLLDSLPPAPRATDEEARALIEARRLMGRGIGFVDVHLLAAAVLADQGRLWTRDRKLASVAHELGVSFNG